MLLQKSNLTSLHTLRLRDAWFVYGHGEEMVVGGYNVGHDGGLAVLTATRVVSYPFGDFKAGDKVTVEWMVDHSRDTSALEIVWVR